MAVEAKRGCGYRKVGGIYMVSGKLGAACGRLPLELHVCPVCSSGIKQTRGFTWVNPGELLAGAKACELAGATVAAGESAFEFGAACATCPLSDPSRMGERAGLLWIGGSFYPTPRDFMGEAASMGVSRRITAVPRGFKLGEHWVLIAHPKAIERTPETDAERAELAEQNEKRMARGEPAQLMLMRKGIITAFKPTAIEKIVTESQSKDTAEMEKLRKAGITPVIVPDDDPDHRGTVYDKEDDAE